MSAGNPQCGPVAAILSQAYVGEDAIAAPVDTGLFINLCGKGQTSGWFGFKCHAWPAAGGPLGVPGSLDHLLPIFTTFFNATAAAVGNATYQNYNAARLLTRLLSRKTYTQPSSAMRLTFVVCSGMRDKGTHKIRACRIVIG